MDRRRRPTSRHGRIRQMATTSPPRESIISHTAAGSSSSCTRTVRPATHCGSPRGVPLSRRLMTASDHSSSFPPSSQASSRADAPLRFPSQFRETDSNRRQSIVSEEWPTTHADPFEENPFNEAHQLYIYIYCCEERLKEKESSWCLRAVCAAHSLWFT